MRILFAGDLHGNPGHLRWLVDSAASAAVDIVIQCGDHGYWPHTAWGRDFVARTADLLERRGIELWWLDGNHDNHQALGRLERDPDGLVTLAPGYRYLPRNSRFSLGGLEFLAHGGAWSVDESRRIPGATWWPEEEVTIEQVNAVVPERIDVLVSHEAPAGQRLSGKDELPRSARQRELVAAIARRVHPRVVVHGHHHTRATWRHADGFVVVGLGCDGMGDHSVWLFDTDEIALG